MPSPAALAPEIAIAETTAAPRVFKPVDSAVECVFGRFFTFIFGGIVASVAYLDAMRVLHQLGQVGKFHHIIMDMAVQALCAIYKTRHAPPNSHGGFVLLDGNA